MTPEEYLDNVKLFIDTYEIAYGQTIRELHVSPNTATLIKEDPGASMRIEQRAVGRLMQDVFEGMDLVVDVTVADWDFEIYA